MAVGTTFCMHNSTAYGIPFYFHYNVLTLFLEFDAGSGFI
jgi:hypothetical protein